MTCSLTELQYLPAAYGVRFNKMSRSKEHGSPRTAATTVRHLRRRILQAGSHSPSKVRPRSRNVLWRTMFLHSALLGAGGHAAQLCCKRCAQAAQHALLPRSGSAVLNHRPRTSHSLGSLRARRCCAYTSCSCMPAGPSVTRLLCKHDRPRDAATDGCKQAGERPRDGCRCVEARGAADGAAQRRRSGRAGRFACRGARRARKAVRKLLARTQRARWMHARLVCLSAAMVPRVHRL